MRRGRKRWKLRSPVKVKLETLQLRSRHGNHSPERRSQSLYFCRGFKVASRLSYPIICASGIHLSDALAEPRCASLTLSQTPKRPHSCASRQRGGGYVTRPHLRAICHLAEAATRR